MRLKVPFFGYVLAVIGFVLPSVILAALLPSLINTEPVKQRLLAELRDWAGSDIELAGPVSIENFFSLSVNLQNVELKGLKGLPKLLALKADRIVARLDWTDLIAGNLDFNKIRIVDASAHLAPMQPEDAAAAVIGMLAPQNKTPFTAFLVANCVVTIDAAPGQRGEVLYIESLTSNLRKSDQRVELDGRLKWKDEPLSFDAVTYTPLTLASAAPVPLQITVASRLLNASFDGVANLAGYLTASGKFMTSTPDALDLTKWLSLDPGPALPQPASVAATLDVTGSRVSMQSAAFSLAGENASGEVNVNFDGKTAGPAIDGALAFEDVDLRKLWALTLIDKQVFPARTDAEWRFFQQASLDVSVSASRPRWDASTLGPIAFTLTGKTGMLTAEIAELGLFNGSILGHVELDLNQDMPRARARLTGDDLDADQILALASQSSWLTGKIDANIEAEIEGHTPAELYKSAVINARINFPDGGQIQLDVPKLSQAAQSFDRDGWDGIGVAQTPFERLRLQLIMDDEFLRFSDLDLMSGSGIVHGLGEVDRTKQLLDWRLSVWSTSDPASQENSAPGQETAAPVGNLSVKGPWAKPKIQLVEQSKRAGVRGEAQGEADAPHGKL